MSSDPANILTPLDVFGSLVADRFPGEDLAEYRDRLAKIAEVLTARDGSDPRWITQREQELEGRIGRPVTLIPGGQDPLLRKTAYDSLFTWRRLETWHGAFRWATPGAAGSPVYFNDATAAGSGVGSSQDLVPYLDLDTGDVLLGSGYVLIDGQIWYIPTRLERFVQLLPDGTTETVILPFHIDSDHGHAISVVDESTLLMTASDHTHTVVFLDEKTWTVSTGGGHTHELVPIRSEGPCFIRCGDVVAPRLEDIDGHMAIPIPSMQMITVRTSDGMHEARVDPYSYYSQSFTIGDETHVHEVALVEGVLTALEAEGHTHTIALPTIPDNRFLVPLIVSYEGAAIDSRDQVNPYIAYLSIEEGWTVLSQPAGLGECLVVAFDTGRYHRLDRDLRAPQGYTLGLGPEEAASQVWITFAEGGIAGSTMRMRIRSEDRFSGGVPTTDVTATLSIGDSSFSQTVTTDDDAEGVFRFQLPDEEGTGVLSFYIDSTLVAEHAVTVFKDDPNAIIQGYGATPYGLDYGM